MRSSRVLCWLLCSCFIFGALCIPASASDTLTDDDTGIAPASIVVGYGGTITVPDLLYGIGTEPVNDLGRVSVYTAESKYNYYDYVSMGKSITGLTSSNQIINLDLGTVTQKVSIGSQTASGFSGTMGIAAYLAYQDPPTGQSTSYWISGSGAIPSSWKMTILGRNLDGEEVTKTLSGSGGTASVDVTNLTSLDSITIDWYFGIKTLKLPAGHNYKTVYPSFRSITNAMVSSANSDANRQEQVIEGINETNNILSGISNGISNIWQGIVSLPGKIAEAIKGLFVPSQEDLTVIKDQYDQLLADRLGFVYQAGDMVTGFFSDFSSALQSEDEYEFIFPGIAFPMNGEIIVICEEMPVDLDNDVMAALRPVLGTIITIISVLGFLNVASDMLEAMISGKSYHDFLHRKDDDG